MSGSYAQRHQRSENVQNTQQTSSTGIPRNVEAVSDELQTIFSPENPDSVTQRQETVEEIIVDALGGDYVDGLNTHPSTIIPQDVVLNADIANTGRLAEDKSLLADKETEDEEQVDEEIYTEQGQFSFWSHFVGIIRKSAINLVLPFINGMMLGFGEILAHEIGFHYHWHGAKVEPPRRLAQRRLQEAGSKYL